VETRKTEEKFGGYEDAVGSQQSFVREGSGRRKRKLEAHERGKKEPEISEKKERLKIFLPADKPPAQRAQKGGGPVEGTPS